MGEKLTGDFRRFMDKNFLGSWDVPDDGDLVLTIDHAEQNDVKNDRGSEKKLVLHWKEKDFKPMILNTTNAKRISAAYGTTKVDEWEGKKVSIYREKITAFGSTQECLRIRDYPPKVEEWICADCGLPIKDHGSVKAKVIANRAISKFNVPLCWDCGTIRNAAESEAESEAN